MDKITDKCTGCRTCEKVCPKACISMKEDSEGFLVPDIDNEQCVNCGLCKSKCPQNKTIVQSFRKKVYAAKAKSESVLMSSSSGGIFYVFAKHTIERGGVVFGAVYRDDFSVAHIKAETLDEIKSMQGSKYVQSNTADTYVECEEYLKSGKLVLYTGTPCQIAGLKSYLKNSYDNLLTIEIICHGVPSGKLFKKYIEWLSVKQKCAVERYKFRSKGYRDWGVDYYYYYYLKNGKSGYAESITDPYYSNFLIGKTYRESCYECKYASENRAADLTIGDYWGIEKFHPDFYDKRGVSVIIVNSAAGDEYFNYVSNEIEYISSTYENAAHSNKNLFEPTKRPNERNYIYKEIDNLPLKVYFAKYYRIPFKIKLKKIIKVVLPDKAILLLKRLK